MTKFPELFAALAAPFEPNEVRVRTQNNRDMKYITARTAMNRLDQVLGPENWFDSYAPNENSVQCALTIRLPDGTLLTKSDAGGYAGMADPGDDDKSGYADGFKRACVKFGVARYLYRDGVPDFARSLAREPDPSDPPAGKGDAYEPPDEPGPLQQSARSARQPERDTRSAPRRDRDRDQGRDQPARGNGNGNGGGHGGGGESYGPPRSGRALFAWVKDMEQKHQVGLLKYINGWSKLQDFPGRMVDWEAEQVALAHAECTRKLAAIGSGDARDEALSN